MTSQIAIATCDAFVDGWHEDLLLVEALAARGAAAAIRSWSDADVDWAGFDATVLRSTWDYPMRRDEFLSWVERVPRLHNPAPVVRHNSDKRYLAELAAAGLPVVPTEFYGPDQPVRLPGGEFVLKPSVGAGSKGAARFAGDQAGEAERARVHAAHLQEQGRTVMVQPYLTEVDTRGETALIFIDGRFSHAIEKSALLPPNAQYALTDPGLAADVFVSEVIKPRTPTAAELALAEAILAAWPAGDRLLYARVDLLPSPNGPVLIELELTEPSLFLDQDEAAPGRLADAVLARLA